jgi:hypothetical protein
MTRSLWLLLSFFAASTHADEAAILNKDFRIMMEWFPGVYDNQEQVYFEGEQGIDEGARHKRSHYVFASAQLPAFGDHVFYVQQHLNDDASEIYRQRLYSFRPDYENNAIRQTIHIPDDSDRLIDAHRPGEDRAVSYAWADPSADRIGITLRWMQAICTLAPS